MNRYVVVTPLRFCGRLAVVVDVVHLPEVVAAELVHAGALRPMPAYALLERQWPALETKSA